MSENYQFSGNIDDQWNEHLAVANATRIALSEPLLQVVHATVAALQAGNKILVMGNGGSASDAMHLAGEIIGRFRRERRAWPAIALCADNAALTAIGNDYGYDQVFRRQIEGLCQAGDIVIGISTSGNSPNVVLALEEAKRLGGITVALSGRDGGKLAAMADHALVVPSPHTPRIQEMHITLIHLFCDLVEEAMVSQ